MSRRTGLSVASNGEIRRVKVRPQMTKGRKKQKRTKASAKERDAFRSASLCKVIPEIVAYYIGVLDIGISGLVDKMTIERQKKDPDWFAYPSTIYRSLKRGYCMSTTRDEILAVFNRQYNYLRKKSPEKVVGVPPPVSLEVWPEELLRRTVQDELESFCDHIATLSPLVFDSEEDCTLYFLMGQDHALRLLPFRSSKEEHSLLKTRDLGIPLKYPADILKGRRAGENTLVCLSHRGRFSYGGELFPKAINLSEDINVMNEFS